MLLSSNILVDENSAGDGGEDYSHAFGVGDVLIAGVGHEAHFNDGWAREKGEPTQKVGPVGAVVVQDRLFVPIASLHAARRDGVGGGGDVR